VFDCVQTLAVFDAVSSWWRWTTGGSPWQGASRLFVRQQHGAGALASAVDATDLQRGHLGPVGSTIAYSIFFALVAFPGADVVGVLILVAIINIPVLIMFALLGASMPRVGGDYVLGSVACSHRRWRS